MTAWKYHRGALSQTEGVEADNTMKWDDSCRLSGYFRSSLHGVTSTFLPSLIICKMSTRDRVVVFTQKSGNKIDSSSMFLFLLVDWETADHIDEGKRRQLDAFEYSTAV